jgi:hypothetical protein
MLAAASQSCVRIDELHAKGGREGYLNEGSGGGGGGKLGITPKHGIQDQCKLASIVPCWLLALRQQTTTFRLKDKLSDDKVP